MISTWIPYIGSLLPSSAYTGFTYLRFGLDRIYLSKGLVYTGFTYLRFGFDRFHCNNQLQKLHIICKL